MNRKWLILMTLLASVGCGQQDFNQAAFDDFRSSTGLAVFHGAQGFGVETVAGRGGQVVRVTNLDAKGPGSLRAALETAGPRTVIFEVGGIIDLTESLVVSEPYLTLAGQTAPSPGITLTGAGLVVLAHDVFIQHIRVRPGDDPAGPDPDARDGIAVLNDAYNVVIDHCSVSWALDEGMSTWGKGVHDVTFSNCIIAENLSHSIHPKGEHSKGMLIGDHSRRIAVIWNLFAHNMQRNPLIKGDVSAFVANNLIYNPGIEVIHFSDPENSGTSRASIMNNIVIWGPDTRWYARMIHPLWTTKRGTIIYKNENKSRRIGGNLVREKSTPEIVPPVEPPAGFPKDSIEEPILALAGARPTDRDAVDQRIVQSVRDGTGRIIDSPSEVGGLPRAVMTRRALTIPENPSGDDDGDGYTNLEGWIGGNFGF